MIGNMSHIFVEPARLVRVSAEIGEAARSPGDLVRNPTVERLVQRLPRPPRAGRGVEAGGVVETSARVGAEKHGSRRMGDNPNDADAENPERRQGSQATQQGFAQNGTIRCEVVYVEVAL